MRGTVRKISLPRRLVADLMHASIARALCFARAPAQHPPPAEARAQAAQPPGWAAIFVKAFALVAKDEPMLRTLYVKWPLAALLRAAAQRRDGGDRAGRGRPGLRAAAKGRRAR